MANLQMNENNNKQISKRDKTSSDKVLSFNERIVNSLSLKLVNKCKKNSICERIFFSALKSRAPKWYESNKRKDIIKRYISRCDSLAKKVGFVLSVTGEKIRNIAALGVAVICAAMIVSATTYDVVLGVYVNGEHVGYLDSKAPMNTAITLVESDMSRIGGADYSFNCNIEYSFVNAKSPKLLNDADCYRIMYNVASKDYVDAYALYVDGEFITACSDHASIEMIIESVSSTEGNLKSDIKSYYQKCLKSTVVEPDEVLRLLNVEVVNSNDDFGNEANDTRVQAYDSVLEADGDDADEIREESAIPRFSLSNSSPIPSTLADGTKITTDKNELLVELDLVYERFETKTEPLAYETTYIESDDYYVGTKMLKTGGREGSAEVTYRIEYDKDGEISREIVAKEVIREPVTEVMVIGTSPAPTANSSGNLIWPTDYSGGISSDYGGRQLFGSYDFHLGVDIINGYGNDIWAADSGIVTHAGYHYSYGYYVDIEHANGMLTRYAHMSWIYTYTGAEVKQGDVIGAIGQTGVATAHHLHFEVRIDDVTVDPLNYLPEP